MSKKDVPVVRQPLSLARLVCIMTMLISLGCVNFVLLKLLYTSYGDHRAFFVNQGVNFLYIVYGGLILYPRMFLLNVVTPEMRQVPKVRFLIMGFLDALGTFFTAMGAAFTPGSMQPLLNQTLIPWIMLASRVYLKKIYSAGELSGAGLILLGACASALPPFFLPHDDGAVELRWYAVCFYALSNVPMAMSACYKESGFKEQELDVWYLTQWVSVFQFLVSFLFMPLLAVPGFSSPEGQPLSEVPSQFYDGWLCFLERDAECAEKQTFLLLVGYCGVNVLFNTLGLYLVKVASALMNALSFAILLPCTTMLFFTPLAGLAQERFTSYNLFTLVGLIIVLLGFVLYQRHGQAVGLPEKDMPKLRPRQTSFQERTIGCGNFGFDVAEVRRIYGTEWQLVRPLLKSEEGGERHDHRYRHAHGDLGLHWHELAHEHEHDPLVDHAHPHKAEHQHNHNGHDHHGDDSHGHGQGGGGGHGHSH